MKALWTKYKSLVYYGVFGILTTLVNIISYLLCFEKWGLANVPSNVVAWILAVLFAYITNKLWVFEARDFSADTIFREFGKFVACRLATGALDLALMYIGVDLLEGSPELFKLGSNILVILLNYVFSRLLIFKK